MSDRILMIEDDARLADMVREYLAEYGFDVQAAHDATSGLALLDSSHDYQALVLDVMLPDLDGFEVCRRVRASSDIPIVMLTARGDDTDRIVGLELGADDYLPKPFNPRELLARLRAVLRRGRASNEAVPRREALRVGSLSLDPELREVRLDDRVRELTAHQFDLLWVLAERAGRAVSRDALMEAARGNALGSFDRSIDVHISRIRAALGDNPKQPKRILTLRGVGYMLVRAEDESTS